MKRKPRYAIYCRVSMEDKQTNENQRPPLIKFAKQKNWDYKVFQETESSRKTRPVKEQLLKQLRAREFEGVLIYKIDRWARSMKELVVEIQELADLGIRFVSLKDNIDLTTASGKLQFHILGAFSEFERELIRERTLDGLERAKREGKSLGRPEGAKDSKPRKTDGYFRREANKRLKIRQVK